MSDTSLRRSVLSDLHELDSFVPSSEQLKAISGRNFGLASKLGVTLNEYLYHISPGYRYKLSQLA